MEDAHLAVPAIAGDEAAAVFGVFDGHGGMCVDGLMYVVCVDGAGVCSVERSIRRHKGGGRRASH